MKERLTKVKDTVNCELPNDKTVNAIDESRSGNGKKFKDADSLFEDLGIDEVAEDCKQG